jgi:hypothetical protein
LDAARRLISDFKSRPKAHLTLAFVVVANQLSFVALAAAPPTSLLIGRSLHRNAPVCVAAVQQGCVPEAGADEAGLSLPSGAEQCPASGPGAACTTHNAAAGIAPGVASTPDGQAPCTAAGANPAPSSPAACTDVLLPTVSPTSPAMKRDPVASPRVTPSVPVSTLRPTRQIPQLDLQVGSAFVQAGDRAVLTATASATVTGSNTSIEIFDRTTRSLAGACTRSSQCIVDYAATSGVHTFAAFIAQPGADLAAAGAGLASNEAEVTWLGVSLESDSTLVAPGKPITFTATSTFDVGKADRVIALYDSTTKQTLTYCSQGTTCSTSLTQSAGGVHEIVGWIPGQPTAKSQSITATWLGASLSGTSTYQQIGGTVHLTA